MGLLAEREGVGGQRLACRIDGRTAAERVLELEMLPRTLGHCLQHPYGFGNDLLPDPIAGQDRDPICRHLRLRSLPVVPPRTGRQGAARPPSGSRASSVGVATAGARPPTTPVDRSREGVAHEEQEREDLVVGGHHHHARGPPPARSAEGAGEQSRLP